MNFNLINDYFSLIKKVANNKNLKIIISIQNTNNIQNNFYLLPPRMSKKYLICGICNSTKESLDYFLSIGINLTKVALLDLEIKKKFIAKEDSIIFNSYQEYLRYKYPNLNVYYFSANLLTIQSVLRRIYKSKTLINENNALLIGIGNIGIKLSLALLDLKINTTIYSKNSYKLNNLKNLAEQLYKFNDIKNIFNFSDNLEKSIKDKNLLILCTPSINILKSKHLESMDKNANIISLSSLPYDQEITEILKKKGINFEYANIGFELLSYVDYLEFISHSFAIPVRVDNEQESYVSGGYRALPGDIVVDNAYDPTFQIGLINKEGQFSSSFKLIKDE